MIDRSVEKLHCILSQTNSNRIGTDEICLRNILKCERYKGLFKGIVRVENEK